MKNLAGDKDCDVMIRSELRAAGIEIIELGEPLKSEVSASVTGRLLCNGRPAFTFRRAWYYWVVNGDVPLNVALEMYADPLGLKDVRVAGNAGNDDPKKWAFPSDDTVREYLLAHKLDYINYHDLAVLCNKGKITSERYVRTYHIDSLEGLILFVKTLKKYNLINDLQFEVVK